MSNASDLTIFDRGKTLTLERILHDVRTGRCRGPAGWTREQLAAHIQTRAATLQYRSGSGGAAPAALPPATPPRAPRASAVDPAIQAIRDEALAKLRAGK